MGRSVKLLIDHLRRRQEEFGVNAFHFHHVYQNNKIQPSCYPPEAEAIITTGSDSKPIADPSPSAEITTDDHNPIADPKPSSEVTTDDSKSISEPSPSAEITADDSQPIADPKPAAEITTNDSTGNSNH